MTMMKAANLDLLWVRNGLQACIACLRGANLGVRCGALNDETELGGEFICSLDVALNSLLCKKERNG